jgi:hypothetical protein
MKEMLAKRAALLGQAASSAYGELPRSMKIFYGNTMCPFGKRISRMTIYPCGEQMRHILEALQFVSVAKCIHELTLLAEDFREHEYGYVWGWERSPGVGTRESSRRSTPGRL